MKIVKDLFISLNPFLKEVKDQCDNFYYLNVLVHFKFYFLEEDTMTRFNEEEWLEYLDTLKACFIIIGAITECADIEEGVIKNSLDSWKRINRIYQFY